MERVHLRTPSEGSTSYGAGAMQLRRLNAKISNEGKYRRSVALSAYLVTDPKVSKRRMLTTHVVPADDSLKPSGAYYIAIFAAPKVTMEIE